MSDQLVIAIIGAGGASALIIAAEVARRWLVRPILLVDFKGGDPSYVTQTHEGPHGEHDVVTNEARYLRVRVSNRGWTLARGCRAYLVKVEKLDETRIPRPTIYCDSLRLNWSAQPHEDKARPMDIPRGVNQFVDVLSTRSTSNDYRPEMPIKLRRYARLFKEHGVFRFTILVAGDGVKPVSVCVEFGWSGVWDQFAARAV